MSVKWLRLLREAYPDLAARAEELNRVDNFQEVNNKKKENIDRDDKHDKSKENKNEAKRLSESVESSNKRPKLS